MDIPSGERRWIAALDGAGSGLVQTSTDRLIGRKLFQWGVGAGGRRWQEWLSGPDAEYIEIQAGLARTQLEHLALPGGATWEWVEAYGLLEADAGGGAWDVGGGSGGGGRGAGAVGSAGFFGGGARSGGALRESCPGCERLTATALTAT